MNPSDFNLLIDRLSTPLDVHERLAILRSLVEFWYGPISPNDGMSGDELSGHRLPLPLRWWYERAGRRKNIMSGQNYLLAPARIGELSDGLPEDLIVFYVENQGVYEWATNVDGEDPLILGRFRGGDEDWTNEGMPLSEFLIGAFAFEALGSAKYGAATAWVPGDVLDRLSAGLPKLPLRPWHWPAFPSYFYGRNGGLMFACPNGEWDGEQGYSVWIGSQVREALAFMSDIVDDEWDYVEL